MSVAKQLQDEVTGWEALDLDGAALKTAKDLQQEQIKSINSDMRELFIDSPLGLRVLKTLMDWTVKRPSFHPLASPNEGYFREGENNIVRCILAACHNSEAGDNQNG